MEESLYLARAIRKLEPNACYSMVNDDHSTIQWVDLIGDAPTKSQIDKAIKDLKAQDIKDATAKIKAKAELLDRLGITEEELKLLLA
jgi:hypothetical protein